MPHVSDVNFYQSDFSQEGLFRLQSQAIRKAASQGPCVFVGRCADYILRDMPMTTNVFITASTDFRIQQLMSKLQCTADEARHRIESGEKARASYYNYYTGKHWGAAESYDLCVCSSTLGLEQTASLIATYIRQRFSLN
jgi:cytidylate kinase